MAEHGYGLGGYGEGPYGDPTGTGNKAAALAVVGLGLAAAWARSRDGE